MRILHYTLGLPPYRSGGLTKYATDLMKEQVRLGDNVYLLFPGGISLFSGEHIRRENDMYGITIYEILNPLPVPLYHGIKNPEDFIPKCNNVKVYEKLFDIIKPNVVHIHTLMGLSISLLRVAKRRNIKVVLTTHDFFGLCLKCTLIDIEGNLCSIPSNLRCAWCNQFAKNKYFLRFRNQPIVIKAKNKLHKSYQSSTNEVFNYEGMASFKIKSGRYGKLIKYYRDIYDLIDLFHFNSGITELVYRQILGNIKGKVLPITNSTIKDNRSKGFNCGKTLRMIFVGHTDDFKGFPLLKSVLLELQQYDWQLDVWGGNEGIDKDTDKIIYKGRYTSKDLSNIYADCTIATVPSQWYETFSFVTLEALSYGVPALVSDHVGAKTIVSEYEPSFIFHNREELKNKLESIMKDRSSVLSYHNKILNMPWHHDMPEHCKEIKEEIYK